MQENNFGGLSEQDAEKKLKEFGHNRLKSKNKKNPVGIFLSQFKDIMVIVLLSATVISVAMGEIYDAVTIILIVLMDAILGFIQEYRTERTMEALEKLTAPTARVIRDGSERVIDASLIVPEDVILIESGDQVPCDGRILRSNGLWCNESILTGESEAVRKGSQDNSVYMGSSVTRGNAVILCEQTGMNTKMGQVSSLIDEAGSEETPLQRKLGSLGKTLCLLCAAVCVLVVIAGILRGEPIFDMLMTGITIAIAAIPEGLPATVTIALALSVRRMMKRNALVRRLHSVETLSCANVVCTDKTGTLTENKMSVTKIRTADKEFSLTGDLITDKCLDELLRCAVLCNNASGDIGDPTEVALLAVAKRFDFSESGYTRLSEIPFDSETKRMSVTVSGNRGVKTYSKGAPDVVLKTCRMIYTESGVEAMTSERRRELYQIVDDYAAGALRVMAFAFTDEKTGCEVFLGLMGMLDAPRSEAKEAVKELRKAGIRTVMITGDHRLTAEAVAKEVGILRRGDMVISKDEIDRMSDKELDRIISKAAVFARVDPSDKLRIVQSLKRKGNIVAMTGDGVNDAPAVKEADIGIAIGQNGSEACKQAADMILLNDNLSTICEAVRQGRTVYMNIRKFVRYLISCNIGEVMVMFLSIVLGMPVVLLPTQILLVNLVTDGLPAMALSLEKSESDILRMKPSEFSGSFFSGGLLGKISVRGILIGLCTLGCFAYSLKLGCTLETARTCALVTLIASQLIHVFECRSEHKSVFRMNPFENPALILAVLVSGGVTALCIYLPFLSVAMETTPLILPEMAWSLMFAAAVPIASGLLGLIANRE
ncbi:MAG: cation-translocating P-type ATPase [Oscillospiraceae bacterium]|nr:cation-translocating P-type ATPase [Ruminococcus sp.]MCD8344465.1 cation-translocating P-type ATPase [Oscillospiraceae bacterium]